MPASEWSISTLSVISSSRASGSRPVRARVRRMSSTRSPCVNCRADRFTETNVRLPPDAPSAAFSTAACRHAASSTQRPRATISPVSSAIGMKASGGTRPRVGCCHRTSASKPTTSPRRRSTSGWYCKRSSSWVNALPRLLAHRRLEHEVAMRRVALGPDHRDLCLAHQLVGGGPTTVPEGDAERRGQEPVPAIDRKGFAELDRDPVGDPMRLGRVDDGIEDKGELITAEAGDGVTRAQAVDEALTDGLQDAVAGNMAERLVDHLEPVEIEQ